MAKSNNLNKEDESEGHALNKGKQDFEYVEVKKKGQKEDPNLETINYDEKEANGKHRELHEHYLGEISEDKNDKNDSKKTFDLMKKNMKKIKLPKSKKKFYVLFGVLGFLIVALAASIVGFIFFNKEEKFTGDNVMIEIKGPEEINSGEEFEYEVIYKNDELAKLADVNVTVRLPEGFKVLEKNPGEVSINTWEIDELRSGQSGSIKIKGILIGEIGSTKNIVASINYKPENFQSQFEKKSNIFTTKIISSAISLDAEIPAQTIANSDTEFLIKYKNTSISDLSNVRIKFLFPSAFVLKSSEPKIEDNQYVDLGKIDKEGEGEIKFIGKLDGEAGEEKEFKIEAGFVKNGSYIAQTEITKKTIIIKAEAQLTLSIEDKEDEYLASFGKKISGKIFYKNLSNASLKDIKIRFYFDPEVVMQDSIETEGKPVRENDYFEWDKNILARLSSLESEKSGEIIFSLKLSDISTQAKADSRLYAELESNFIDNEDAGLTQQSNEIKLKFSTTLNLNTEARYFDEEFKEVGAGPLPPEVGKQTTYQVVWTINNTVNDVRDVTVYTVLPKGAVLGKKGVSAGNDLAFDLKSRTLSWRINEVPAKAGIDFAELQAVFEVSIEPGSSDLGKFILLIEETVIEGTDKVTGAAIREVESRLTTDLENDIGARGKGKVVEESNSNLNGNSNVNGD